VRSIHCLENLGQRTPRDIAQQTCPRRTSSPLHRVDSQKSRVIILIETDLLISSFLLYVLSEFAVAVNSMLVWLNSSVAKYYAAFFMTFLLKEVLIPKLNNLLLLRYLYEVWTGLVCMQLFLLASSTKVNITISAGWCSCHAVDLCSVSAWSDPADKGRVSRNPLASNFFRIRHSPVTLHLALCREIMLPRAP